MDSFSKTIERRIPVGMRVSKKSILWLLTVCAFFLPNELSNVLPGWNLFSNAVFLITVISLLRTLRQPSRLFVTIVAYYSILLASTYVNETVDIHTLMSTLKAIAVVLFIEKAISENPHRILNILYAFFLCFAVIDLLTIFLFPKGWYLKEFSYNEWSTGYDPIWFLGRKNNHVLWFVATIFLGGIKCLTTNRRNDRIALYILSFFMLAGSMFVLHSSTTVFVILLCILGLSVTFYRKKILKINGKLVVSFYVVMQFVVLLGSGEMLSPILNTFFGKDATFSGRTSIWAKVLPQIFQKPLFGSGIQLSEDAIALMGNLSFVNAHNQWLQTLWEGGIASLLLLIVMFMAILTSIKKSKDTPYYLLSFFILGVVLLDMTFEVIMNNRVFWLVLIALNYTYVFVSDYSEDDSCTRLIHGGVK